MFTAAHPPCKIAYNPNDAIGLLDSGAFTDPPHKRLSAEQALERQFQWERKASKTWETVWRAYAFASYDVLIDETWVDGKKYKRRWSIDDAESAVEHTIVAARYLAGQRERLAPRKLILSCQGVDAIQYEECVIEVLKVARPDDWIGLGGWCILGQRRYMLPTFWATLHRIVPRIAAAGIGHVHIFGVLYQPALAGLLWITDQYGISVSTDSTAPIMHCTFKFNDSSRVKAASGYWKDNVAWWVQTMAGLRNSEHYKRPPEVSAVRSLSMDLGLAS